MAGIDYHKSIPFLRLPAFDIKIYVLEWLTESMEIHFHKSHHQIIEVPSYHARLKTFDNIAARHFCQ